MNWDYIYSKLSPQRNVRSCDFRSSQNAICTSQYALNCYFGVCYLHMLTMHLPEYWGCEEWGRSTSSKVVDTVAAQWCSNRALGYIISVARQEMVMRGGCGCGVRVGWALVPIPLSARRQRLRSLASTTKKHPKIKPKNVQREWWFNCKKKIERASFS